MLFPALDGLTSTSSETPIANFLELRKSELRRIHLPRTRVNRLRLVLRCAWNRRTLTYAFGNLCDDVRNNVARNAVRRAFKTWARAGVGLSFHQAEVDNDDDNNNDDGNANPDIFVEWRQAADPDHSMVGGILAHADFPPGCSVIVSGLPIPCHFDNEERTWVDGGSGGFDIETVALHEIGHLLGLLHTDVSGSVMFPFVSANTTLCRLQSDDLAGIRALYPPFP
jgi:hypothetical protein